MQKGFALIELMVVVAILSVIAALTVPRFLRHQTATRQEECHRNLKSLVQAEKEFFEKNQEYTDNLKTLGWGPEAQRWYEYRFLPSPSPKSNFLFGCIGNIDKDPTLDEATIDEKGDIRQITNDVNK